ncbi:1-acyl-sn-glycerol-3-phosphate acyltransferase [Nocardioides sp. CFH 31398]|uniref:lysophospholipid acyltransferase family protein n=1 Tax=Nocardioides sp. CFH 31398 TaxID=2919579 RepID=UPI0023DAF251|nr:lysophospholipid acyltransferase family protein [Nocardioides sp. CFH 31398]
MPRTSPGDVARRDDADARFHQRVLRGGDLLLRAWGVRVRVSGLEHLPASGPVVLAANHVSYPDFVLVQKAVWPAGRTVHFLCRADVFDVRVVGTAMRRMRHVPVDRSAPAAAYLQARDELRAGGTVGIFPEAGVSMSYTVRPLMRGAAALALETGAPLVPVSTWGGQRLWRAHAGPDGRRPRPDPHRGRVVDVALSAPLRPEPGEDATALTVRLGRRLAEGLDRLWDLPEHRTPPGPPVPWLPAHRGGSAPTAAQSLGRENVPRGAVPVAWGPGPGAAPGTAAG